MRSVVGAGASFRHLAVSGTPSRAVKLERKQSLVFTGAVRIVWTSAATCWTCGSSTLSEIRFRQPIGVPRRRGARRQATLGETCKRPVRPRRRSWQNAFASWLQSRNPNGCTRVIGASRQVLSDQARQTSSCQSSSLHTEECWTFRIASPEHMMTRRVLRATFLLAVLEPFGCPSSGS